MKRVLFWFIFLLTLIEAPLSYAFNEPNAFRGIPWGDTEQAVVEKIYGEVCSDTKDISMGDRVCAGNFSIGSVAIKGVFSFLEGGFIGVSLTFNSLYFDVIKKIFILKYGSPTKEYSKKLGSMNIENFTMEWDGNKIYIYLEKYMGGTDLRSLARVETKQREEISNKTTTEMPNYTEEDIKKWAEDL